MGGFTPYRLAQLGSLTLLFARICLGVEFRGFLEPKCDGVLFDGGTMDCQAAIDEILGLADQDPSAGQSVFAGQGCTDFKEHGTCLISVCDSDGATFLLYQGVAEAAQQIVASCQREDKDNAGGSSVIEGFQREGAHTIATVKVRGILRLLGEQQPETRNIVPRQEPGTPNREFADARGQARVETESNLFNDDRNGDAAYLYDMLPQTETRLREDLYNEWTRRRPGFWAGYRRREAVGVEVLETNPGGSFRYNFGVTARGGQHITDYPIVDRQNIILAFFRLFHREGNPRNFQANLYDGVGRFVGVMTLMSNEGTMDPGGQVLVGPGENY